MIVFWNELLSTLYPLEGWWEEGITAFMAAPASSSFYFWKLFYGFVKLAVVKKKK